MDTLLLIGFLASFAASIVPPIDRNTDRLGWDLPEAPISTSKIKTSEDCLAACLAEPLCVSWAFTRDNSDDADLPGVDSGTGCPGTARVRPIGPGCRLKSGLAGVQDNECGDSGWIPQRVVKQSCQPKHFVPWSQTVPVIGHNPGEATAPSMTEKLPPRPDPFELSREEINRRGDIPFPASNVFYSMVIAPECSISYGQASTWYCSWSYDDTLRCIYEDGTVNDVTVNGHPVYPESAPEFHPQRTATTKSQAASYGVVTVSGSHPFRLTFENPLPVTSHFSGFDGRFPSGNFFYKGVWYTSSSLRTHKSSVIDCESHCVSGPLVSWFTSHDDGETWQGPGEDVNVSDAYDNLWWQNTSGQLGIGVKFGEVHVVDLGQEVVDSRGYMYVIGHGVDPHGKNPGWGLWNQGDGVYLARIKPSPETINDPLEWQFWCGDKCQNIGATEYGWTSALLSPEGHVRSAVDTAQPIFTWPNKTGSVSMTYVPTLNRFLTVFTAPHTANKALDGSDLTVLESPSITGPFSMVAHWENFGPTAYFPSFPSKFIGSVRVSEDGDDEMKRRYNEEELELWLSYSTLNNYVKRNMWRNPKYGGYAWNLVAIKLKLKPTLPNRYFFIAFLLNSPMTTGFILFLVVVVVIVRGICYCERSQQNQQRMKHYRAIL